MTDISTQVKEVIINELKVNAEAVTDEARFSEDLGADSLDIVETVMSLEEHFDINIADEAVETMNTVGDVINYITEAKG